MDVKIEIEVIAVKCFKLFYLIEAQCILKHLERYSK